MNITTEFKTRILAAMEKARANYFGSDTAFAKTLSIDKAVYNRLKKGETYKLLSDQKWNTIGRILNVEIHQKNIITAKTEVYKKIENDIIECQKNSTSLIFVDECEIGKTYSARKVVEKLKNAFYVDCSQAKSKQLFIRLLAQTIGVDNKGKYNEVKLDLKFAINNLERPIIVLDETGDLEYNAFLEVKELWNATEGTCGWYMIGADGLRDKIRKGINNKKVGYREIFSRFNNKFMSIVPIGNEAKSEFYAILIADFLTANLPTELHFRINDLIPRIMGNTGKTDKNGKFDKVNFSEEIGCLRRAETFVNLIKREMNEASTHAK